MAKQRILVQNPYFIPGPAAIGALAKAVRRGVDVRVMVPGSSDVRVIEWASTYALRALVKAGVKILRWRGPMLHAKTATIDGTWSTIGSYNFDAQSRFSNLEVTVEILDPGTAQALMKNFERGVENCEPWDESSWQRLPWWKKALSWLAFRFRRWL
jgi:cardiolipin synthase